MYGLVVRFDLKAGCESDFDTLAESTVAKIRQHEPDTLLYGVHTVTGEPRTRIFYELYRDAAAFQHHENQPYIRHFLEARTELIDSFQVDRLTPTTYAGL